MSLFIGLRYKYLRKLEGFTQDELATKILLSRQFYGGVERGKSMLHEDSLPFLATALSMPAKYLRGGEEDGQVHATLQLCFRLLLEDKLEDIFKHTVLETPIDNLGQEVMARLLLATAHYAQRNLDEAEKLERDYLSHFLPSIVVEEMPDYFQSIFYFFEYQRAFYHGHFQKSLECSNLLEALAETKSDLTLILLKKVGASIKQGNYTQADAILRKAFKLIDEKSKPSILIQAYIYNSAIFGHFQMYDGCLEILERIENAIEEPSLEKYRIVVAQQRGYIYSKKNKLDEALAYYEEALSYHSTIERQVGLHVSFITITLKLNDTAKSREYLSKARQLELTEYEKAVLFSCESEIHLIEGDEEAFLKMKKMAMKYFEENRSWRDLEYNYSFMFNYFKSKNNHKKAAEFAGKKENLKHEKN